jgi:hypothetical protein
MRIVKPATTIQSMKPQHRTDKFSYAPQIRARAGGMSFLENDARCVGLWRVGVGWVRGPASTVTILRYDQAQYKPLGI